MKRTIAIGILVIVGATAWQVGSKLSADAIGMGVGVIFGVMAGIPTALLLLASNRRNDAARTNYDAPPPPRYQQQPPVIVFAAPHQTQPQYDPYGGCQGYAPALPEPEHSILPPVPWDGNGYAPARPTAPRASRRDWTDVDGW